MAQTQILQRKRDDNHNQNDWQGYLGGGLLNIGELLIPVDLQGGATGIFYIKPRRSRTLSQVRRPTGIKLREEAEKIQRPT